MKPLKKWQKFAAVSLAAVLIVVTTFTSSLAWFETKNDTHLDAGRGRTATAFFASGDGESAETAYEINQPIHLYNLAWLQYMGKFNTVTSGSVNKVYFKITADLDMTDWVLPPIGTAKYPFVGELVGNGNQISNLKVDNRLQSETDAGAIVQKPSSITQLATSSEYGVLDIVGFFGVIGTDSAVGSYSYSNAAPSVSGFYLNNVTVTSRSTSTLGGIAAGYVAGSYMEDVGISASTLSFAKNNAARLNSNITNNLSDYTTLGFTKDTASIQQTETTVVIPTQDSQHSVSNGGGSENGWGGSVDFNSMFTRVAALRDRVSNNNGTYSRGVMSETITETITTSYVGGVASSTPTSSTSTTNYTASNLKHYDSRYNGYKELEGEIAYRYRSTNTDRYVYLTGGNADYAQFPKTVTTNTTTKYGTTQTYRIALNQGEIQTTNYSYTTYYVKIRSTYGVNANTGTSRVTSTNNSNTTYWAFMDANGNNVAPTYTGGYYMFTRTNNTNYYVASSSTTGQGNATLTTDKESALLLTYASNRIVGYRYNNNNYNLYQGNNCSFRTNTGGYTTISFTEQSTTFSWSESETVYSYLSATTSAVQAVHDADEAMHWILSAREGENGALYTTINNRDYYLNASTTSLSISTSPTTYWTRSNSNILSTTINNQTYYFRWTSANGFSMNGTSGTTTYWTQLSDAVSETKTLAAYYLNYNSQYYLTATASGVGSTTTSGNATPIMFENGKGSAGKMFFLVGSTVYYLYIVNTTTLGVTTDYNTATTWTSTSGNGNISATYSNRTYYLYYNNNTFRPYTNAQTIRSTSAGNQTAAFPKASSTSSTTETIGNGVEFPETYFPLTVNENDYEAAEGNSGYIISGSNSETATMIGQDDPEASANVGGDVRVSKYSVNNNNSNDISAAMNGNSTFQSSSLAVIGRSYRTNGFVHITDEVFDSGSNGSSALNNAVTTKTSYTAMGLEKYADSRSITNTNAGLQSIFGGSQYVYGIHFMNANISTDNLCIAKKARIDAETYDDYPMPRDCIDFHLREDGFINFFGASMYSGDNSFFSIHQINRDATTKEILSIKEISKIYGVVNANNHKIDHSFAYIYRYGDGTNSATIPSNYSMVFDMTWVTNPATYVDNAVYYYEVPVNAGEYALGSTSGTGAYLIYLDLAANAMEYDYTSFFEYSKTIITEFEYPNGVAVVNAKGDSTNPKDSVALAVPSADTIVISRNTTNDAFAKYAKSDESVVYVGYGLTMYVGNTDPPATKLTLTDLDSVSQKVIEKKQVTTVSYNYTMDRTEITITTATITDGGTPVYTGRQSIDGGDNWTAMGTPDTSVITTTWADAANDPSEQDTMVTFTAISIPVYVDNELVDVTIDLLITYTRDTDNPENFFQVCTGYAVTVTNPSTTDALDVKIGEIYMEGNTIVYTVKINGTTVTGTAQVIPVAASTGS